MPKLPTPGWSFLVRTDFNDQNRWDRLSAIAADADEAIECVSDPSWAGAGWEAIRDTSLGANTGGAVVFVVDGVALQEGFPLLAVDLWDRDHAPFRCAADQLYNVVPNLELGNCDWTDFAERLDADGVHRGHV